MERLCGEGMERSGVAPTCFHSPARATKALVHSDDFVIAGPRTQVEHARRKIRAPLEREPRASLEIVILGRLVAWNDTHVEIEADYKLARAARHKMGIVQVSNGLTEPAVREEGDAGDCIEF